MKNSIAVALLLLASFANAGTLTVHAYQSEAEVLKSLSVAGLVGGSDIQGVIKLSVRDESDASLLAPQCIVKSKGDDVQVVCRTKDDYELGRVTQFITSRVQYLSYEAKQQSGVTDSALTMRKIDAFTYDTRTKQ